ncbi:hypothetical protein KSS87_000290 [Heliosperma pusillum]|nr:hypothetical protein KSS87_000290 [Heliosperma pusillum]
MPRNAESGSFDDRLMEVEQHEELGQVDVISSLVKSIRDSFKEQRRGISKFRNLNPS